MFWPMLAVALGFLGIAVLGVLGVRVFIEAQRLGRQVTRTTQRINSAAEELEKASLNLARTGDGLPYRRPAADAADTPRTPPP
ncbi:membrane protein [Streptomyces roseolilacinus]|uniref:Membrane protein n=1 Tax=Streptomyces roseolilacinus TaxID=66904 RepID=A0A918B431_9ACTN|nr:membrane protein [Streptomyces roseolilacinus]